MKVISFNVGYFLGFQAQRHWLRRPHRLLYGSKSVERAGMKRLVDLLQEEDPDVVALQEVDLGSVRAHFNSQIETLSTYVEAKGLNFNYRADIKYGQDTLPSNLPMLQKMSNAVLWKNGQAHARYLSNGTKRLVHVIESPRGPTVISVHLSKTEMTREKQLRELATITEEHNQVVLTGDFNVKDKAEFNVLTENAGLELHIPGKSFSTAYPTYAFDVFLTSDGRSITRCEVLNDVQFSDHLPVVAEVN